MCGHISKMYKTKKKNIKISPFSIHFIQMNLQIHLISILPNYKRTLQTTFASFANSYW
jgi:hypothetical protein